MEEQLPGKGLKPSHMLSWQSNPTMAYQRKAGAKVEQDTGNSYGTR